MAKEYNLFIDGHPSIYKPKLRKLKIYFCEPEIGVSRETGVLLFISGFGGHANSNVYKKMRSQFADKYNLVTIQCEYFGWEFMQQADDVIFNIRQDDIEDIFNTEEINGIYPEGILNISRLLEIGSKYKLTIPCKAKINEDLTNFNDMGIMQAIDNISAVLAVVSILDDNGLEFNRGKIMSYGHSHGAYLSYLCNAFAPNLFSVIIDNSSWIYPRYLVSNRLLYQKVGNNLLVTEFEYLAKEVFTDEELLALPVLYRKIRNKCKIISYHGVNDSLITHQEKRNFCTGVNNCIYKEISEKDVDGKVFKSTNHGLDSDFLELFDYAINNNSFYFDHKKEIRDSIIEYQASKYTFAVDYRRGLPIITLD